MMLLPSPVTAIRAGPLISFCASHPLPLTPPHRPHAPRPQRGRAGCPRRTPRRHGALPGALAGRRPFSAPARRTRGGGGLGGAAAGALDGGNPPHKPPRPSPQEYTHLKSLISF